MFYWRGVRKKLCLVKMRRGIVLTMTLSLTLSGDQAVAVSRLLLLVRYRSLGGILGGIRFRSRGGWVGDIWRLR